MERPKIFVLDASVVLKWFTEENESDKAKKYRQEYEDSEIEIAVPDLLIYEIANALIKGKNLTSKDIKAATQSIRDMDFFIFRPAKPIMDKAVELAEKFDLTIYDACYVALAELLDAKFVTADSKLANKLAKLEYVYLLSDS